MGSHRGTSNFVLGTLSWLDLSILACCLLMKQFDAFCQHKYVAQRGTQHRAADGGSMQNQTPKHSHVWLMGIDMLW